jgi:hypothetical protein
MADALDFSAYYYIRNGYFTNYYAALNTSNKQIGVRGSKGTGDIFLWSFTKNTDGTVCIYNKANGEAAYIGTDADDQTLMVGKEYNWTLIETTTDQGNKGIGIVSGNGSSAWYVNPSAWNYVLTKPYTWGGSVWTLEKSDVQVETGITEVKTEDGKVKGTYDLAGRQVEAPTAGIYIVNGNKVLVK